MEIRPPRFRPAGAGAGQNPAAADRGLAMNSDRLLEIGNLTIIFGGITSVDNVSLSVRRGSVTSIIGPNGAGKTTLFNMISGIYRPTTGSILFNGREIVGKKQHEISRLGIARTFQNIRLYEGLSVLENVQTVLDARAGYNFFQALLRLPGTRRIDRDNVKTCEEYLDLVGLLEHRDEKPNSLPYGMQRKLEIARALAASPELLLLDEPAAGLNTMEVSDLINLIGRIKERFGLTVLLIEHRLQLVYTLSEKVYVLSFGELLAEGTPEVIQNDERVIAAYMGGDD
jgi:branched-chain amino acid transport system ATP-binding protein